VTGPGPQSLDNALINGGYDIAQRQVLTTLTTYSNTSGRTFGADRWGMTNQNASVQFAAVDTNAAPETGLQARYFGRFKKITNAGKIVVSQVIEGTRSEAMRGRSVRLQCKMRFSVAASMTVRLGLLELNSSGTVDTMPATFISAFGANSTDPTFGTNLALIAPTSAVGGTVVGNAVTCVLTSSWVVYSGIFPAPSTMKNLVAVVFTDAQPAANDELNIAEMGLYNGSDIQEWDPRLPGAEIALCQRYYAKTFPGLTAPAQNAGVTTGCLP
jgi:hypothetical protein